MRSNNEKKGRKLLRLRRGTAATVAPQTGSAPQEEVGVRESRTLKLTDREERELRVGKNI